MIDVQLLRGDIDAAARRIADRGTPIDVARFQSLESVRKTLQTRTQELQARRNQVSKQVGQAKQRGEDAAALMAEVSSMADELKGNESKLGELQAELNDFLLGVPNIPHASVPTGASAEQNVEVRRYGEPRSVSFMPKDHVDLGEGLGLLDLGAATKIAGARFAVMQGSLARLHRAIAQFMLDLHTGEHGMVEHWTPVLVREDAMVGTTQLPKFAGDSYRTTDGLWLIPTSEVTLTNLAGGQILDAGALPLRMTAHTQCFRSEAGSAGKDTAGMLRQHQFEKVEMVSITTPEASRAEHERMTRCAETVLERLGLPYRTVVLSTGDMGFGARRTHDLEVWLPGQDAYREISSCSVCGDFQARRMNARFRRGEGAKPEFVHTLNGSGLAVGRTLIAVLENGQEADGSVTLPAALHPHLGGRTRIDREGRLA
jgi:seryl-tRNA synthetase